jgi:hypothetical protein
MMSLHTHPTRAPNLSERNVQAQPAFPLDIVITVTDHRDGGRVHSVCARNQLRAIKDAFHAGARFADRNLKEQHHAKAAQGAAAVKSDGEATGKAKKSRA